MKRGRSASQDGGSRPGVAMGRNGPANPICALGIRAAILALLVTTATLPPEPRPYVDALTKGHALHAAGRYRAALAAYERAHALRPRAIAPLTAEARAELDLGKPETALTAFSAIADIAEPPSATLIEWGKAHDAVGDTAQAIRLWLEAAQRGEGDAQYLLGGAYLDLGDWDAAERHLQSCLESTPPDDGLVQRASYRLALALACDDPMRAAEALQRATGGPDVRVAADAATLLQTLHQAQAGSRGCDTVWGAGLFNLGESRPAERYLRQALAHRPDDIDALAYLGAITGERGDAIEADTLLQRALALDGNHPLALYFHGRQQLRQGDPAGARNTLSRLLALDPQNAAACVEIARTFQAEGKYALAEEWFEAAVTNAPLAADFLYVLADFEASTLFDVDRGLDVIRDAVETVPTDPAMHDLLGWLRFLAGDRAGAETALRHALELEPRRVSAYYHLGRLYEGEGDPNAARWAFGQAVDLGAGQPAQSAAELGLRRLGPGPETDPTARSSD